MVRRLDLDKDRDAQAQLAGIGQRDPARQHALRLEPLHALPARRLRQTDLFGDLGNGQGGVLHQLRHDLAVYQVQIQHGFALFPARLGVCRSVIPHMESWRWRRNRLRFVPNRLPKEPLPRHDG